MAWSASDKVTLVAEPGLFSVAGTERTMRAIQLFRQEFAPKLSPAGIVANRVRSGSAEHTFRLSEMESMFGELLLSPHIPEQANWQQIQGAAHSIHHWPGDSAKNAAGPLRCPAAEPAEPGQRGPGRRCPRPQPSVAPDCRTQRQQNEAAFPVREAASVIVSAFRRSHACSCGS